MLYYHLEPESKITRKKKKKQGVSRFVERIAVFKMGSRLISGPIQEPSKALMMMTTK